jgi:hypothetical protein
MQADIQYTRSSVAATSSESARYPSSVASPRYTLSDLRDRRADIAEVAARHHATNIRVIGSAARGDSDALSDIDLMVDMDPTHTLNGFAYHRLSQSGRPRLHRCKPNLVWDAVQRLPELQRAVNDLRRPS